MDEEATSPTKFVAALFGVNRKQQTPAAFTIWKISPRLSRVGTSSQFLRNVIELISPSKTAAWRGVPWEFPEVLGSLRNFLLKLWLGDLLLEFGRLRPKSWLQDCQALHESKGEKYFSISVLWSCWEIVHSDPCCENEWTNRNCQHFFVENGTLQVKQHQHWDHWARTQKLYNCRRSDSYWPAGR